MPKKSAKDKIEAQSNNQNSKRGRSPSDIVHNSPIATSPAFKKSPKLKKQKKSGNYYVIAR